MDLYLSKLIPLFIVPLGFALVISILAMGILGLSVRLARLFLFVAVSVLWVASTPIFAGYLGLTLENRYPPVGIEATPTADAIVVLGGAVGGQGPPRITVDLTDAADRVLHTARLFRAGKAPVVLVSGGAISWLGTDIPEAASVRTLLEEWGVPGASILVEDHQPHHLRECRVDPTGPGGTRAASDLAGDLCTAYAAGTGDLSVRRHRRGAGGDGFHCHLK